MEWIKSSEREPSNDGRYYCKYNGVEIVLDFVKLQPQKERFVINGYYTDSLLNESRFWTEDVNSSSMIKSHSDLLWLDEN